VEESETSREIKFEFIDLFLRFLPFTARASLKPDHSVGKYLSKKCQFFDETQTKRQIPMLIS
jgi:hypothetical protein